MIVEFLNLIKNKKELVILLLSIFLCVIAIYNPVVTIKKSITSLHVSCRCKPINECSRFKKSG